MKATWLIENLSHEEKSLGPRMPVSPDQCLGTVYALGSLDLWDDLWDAITLDIFYKKPL